MKHETVHLCTLDGLWPAILWMIEATSTLTWNWPPFGLWMTCHGLFVEWSKKIKIQHETRSTYGLWMYCDGLFVEWSIQLQFEHEPVHLPDYGWPVTGYSSNDQRNVNMKTPHLWTVDRMWRAIRWMVEETSTCTWNCPPFGLWMTCHGLFIEWTNQLQLQHETVHFGTGTMDRLWPAVRWIIKANSPSTMKPSTVGLSMACDGGHSSTPTKDRINSNFNMKLSTFGPVDGLWLATSRSMIE